MLRLAEFALFLAPFAAFAVWRFTAAQGGPSTARAGLTAVGVVVLFAGPALASPGTTRSTALRRYVPARIAERQHRARPRHAPAVTEQAALRLRTEAGLPGRSGAARPCSPRCRTRGWSAARCATRWPGGPSPTSTSRPRPRRSGDRGAAAARASARCRPGSTTARSPPCVDGRGFEITTLRRDVETDGRHAARRLHRRLAGRCGAARLHHQRHVDDAETARCSTISAASPICGPASSASSATRRPASPRTICASCASSASSRATAAARPTPRRWAALAEAAPRPRTAVARARVERVGPHPGRARSRAARSALMEETRRAGRVLPEGFDLAAAAAVAGRRRSRRSAAAAGRAADGRSGRVRRPPAPLRRGARAARRA